MGDDHEQRNRNIDNAHDRDQRAGDLGQALGAAHDAQREQDSQDDADDQRGALAVEREARERGLQVVGGEHVVADRIGQDDDDGEYHAQPALVQRGLNIVGRAAVARAILVAALVDLRQGGLDKRGRAAQDCSDPHPEHRAVAAEADRARHTDDVAGADTGGRGYHQRTEGGNGALSLGLLGKHAEGLAQQTDLDKLAAEGEGQARHHQQQRHPGHIQHAADRRYDGVDALENRVHSNHTLFSLLFCKMIPTLLV